MANHGAAFLEGVESSLTPRPARSGRDFPEACFIWTTSTWGDSAVSTFSNAGAVQGPHCLGGQRTFSWLLGVTHFTEIVGLCGF